MDQRRKVSGSLSRTHSMQPPLRRIRRRGREKRRGVRMNRGPGDPIEQHDDNETIFDGFGAHKPNNSIPGAEAVGREKIATANIVYRLTGRFRG